MLAMRPSALVAVSFVLDGLLASGAAAQGCGDPRAGNCCIGLATPGCSDAECCETVCKIDSFCCEVLWDGICAAEAIKLCPYCEGAAVCGAGEGSCCIAHDTPSCNDAQCCYPVCLVDPTCCTEAWDFKCLQIAAFYCECPFPPCPADFDESGFIDAADLGVLLGAWGSAGATDLDGDGTTGAADLAILLGGWGAC